MALSDGLERYWALDGNTNDSVGSEHGTVIGTLGYTAGLRSQQALVLDGLMANRIQATAYRPTADFSVSFWVRQHTPAVDANCLVLAHVTGASNTMAGWGIRAQVAALHYGVAVDSTSDTQARFYDVSRGAGIWFHCVLTRATNTYTTYLNGVKNVWTSANAHVNTGTLAVGGRNTATGTAGIDANIQDIAFYNRVLSDDEALQLYNDGDGLTYAQILAAPAAPSPSGPPIDNICEYIDDGEELYTLDVSDYPFQAPVPANGPQVSQFEATSDTTATVTFTVPVKQINPAGPNDALNPANYTIHGLTISGVTSLAPNEVSLTTSSQSNITYNWSVQNIHDINGNVIIQYPV